VHDDRGAAVWHWSKDGHDSALNLNPAALTLADDSKPQAPAEVDWTHVKVETGATPPRKPQDAAFNPYATAKPAAARADGREPRGKPRDLRALSKWIELQRRLKAEKDKAGED
jgi:hypothetical protein